MSSTFIIYNMGFLMFVKIHNLQKLKIRLYTKLDHQILDEVCFYLFY